MKKTKKWEHPHPDEIAQLLSKLPKSLRADQMGVVDVFVDAYQRLGTKGILIAPPGWGKTITILEIMRQVAEIENDFVGSFFEPRITLCGQTIDAAVRYLVDQCDEKWGIVMVSSGSPYARTQSLLNRLFASYAHNDRIKSTTTPSEVSNQVERLRAAGLKVLVVGTYHSNKVVLRSDIHFHVKAHDECHNLVTQSDISGFRTTHDIPANLTISTTASPRNTASENGDGMQNVSLWGSVLADISAHEAMGDKVILPQRLDLVDMALDGGRLNDPIDEDFPKIVDYLFSVLDQDEQMLCDFAGENAHLIGPKVLFGLPGQFWLRAIMLSPQLREYMVDRRDVNLVGMSSGLGVWVWPAGKNEPEHYSFTGDGKDELFSFVDDLSTTDKLIFLHVRTVGEGTDLPLLTGFAPMCDLSKTRIIQDCNRPGRLGPHDRYRQVMEGKIPEGEWVKPFALVHLPCCIEGGQDVVDRFENILRDMRSSPEFDPTETIYDPKRCPLPESDESQRDTSRNPRGNPYDQIAEFWHSCERADAEDERWKAIRDLRIAIHEGNDDLLDRLLEMENES